METHFVLKEELSKLAQELVDAPSPNPPGDVTLPIEVAARYLTECGITFARITLDPEYRKVNLVARVFGEHPGPHLVMNAHLDVFPATGEHSPENENVAGSDPDRQVVLGRGAVDMKSGAAVFLVVLKLLNERRSQLHGSATLCLVCDEETFGPYGSRLLLETFPELSGDALLSTEPSSLSVVRIGERGFVWATAEFSGKGGHGAYPGAAESPIEKAAAFIAALREHFPEDWINVKESGNNALSHDLLAPIGKSFVDSVSLNYGTINGGVKVNMQPEVCRVEIDIRLPIGTSSEDIIDGVRRIVSSHKGTLQINNTGDANKNDENSPLFEIMKQAVKEVTGVSPALAIGLGCTDARLWRYRGVTAGVYGPDPSTMAHGSEYLFVDDLMKIASVHWKVASRFLRVLD